MRLSRLIYLSYYIKKLDKEKLCHFLSYASKETGKSRMRLLCDAVCSVLVYNISILDYFYFRFFELDRNQRRLWAGTGFLYEFQLRMNPRSTRSVLEDKVAFLRHFDPFVHRQHADIDSLCSEQRLQTDLFSNSSGKLVLKDSLGQVGAEVDIISCKDFSPESLIQYMKDGKYNLIEEYVIQHKSIMDLSPSGLNTVRIFTQLYEDEVHILGARFRVSVNSPVDNMGAGNLAAAVDIQTGTVTSPGVYSDISKTDQEFHPITGKRIQGFIIPFWDEVVDLAKRAALHNTDNKSVGWDIAITKDGPELIEGNHNWCKLLWQLPVKKA